MIRGVSSVEQSSTITSSISVCVWLRQLSIAPRRYLAPLYVGRTILTFGERFVFIIYTCSLGNLSIIRSPVLPLLTGKSKNFKTSRNGCKCEKSCRIVDGGGAGLSAGYRTGLPYSSSPIKS